MPVIIKVMPSLLKDLASFEGVLYSTIHLDAPYDRSSRRKKIVIRVGIFEMNGKLSKKRNEAYNTPNSR